jgi:hypothetical protein
MTRTQVFFRRLTANRGRFGFMVALVAVAAVMWGRLLLKTAPQAAVADPARAAAQPVLPDAGDPLFSERPTVVVALTDQSPRDVFRLNPGEFPKVDKPNVIPPPNPLPEKSDEARRAEMSALLKDLRLQSTVMSERPAALINDRLFNEGSQPVPGFTITRITQHSVFLKRAELDDEFELRMYRN